MNLESNMLPKGKFFPKSCTICGVHFKSARHFTVHSQRKNICRPKPYTCRKCGKVFNYYWNLIAHEKRKYPCGLKIPKVKNKIASHIQTEKCSLVSGYLYEEKTASINMSSLKKLTSLTCHKCGESFRSHSSYYRHRKKCLLNHFLNDVDIIQNKIYSCKPKTDTSFTLTESFETGDCSPSNNNEHFQELAKLSSIPEKQICSSSISDNKSVYKATDIMYDRSFKTRNTFSEQGAFLPSTKSVLENEKADTKKNTKLEKDKYEFTCEVCGYICFNVYTWCKHMKKHKSIKIPKGFLKCPVCNETFCTPYILFRHQRKLKHWREVQKITPNHYKNDDKVSFSTSSLIKQVESRDKIDPNGSSSACNQLMSHRRPLSMKLRDIAQIKKKKWNKIRIKKINKAINVQSGKGPRKYPDKCPVCGKFVTLLSTCRHFQNKSEHLSFVCKWCSRRFKYFREMTRHQQMKHRDLLPFECIRCEQRFPKRSCTLNHISQLHKDVPKDTLVKERSKAGQSSLSDKSSANTHFQIQKSNTCSDKHLGTNNFLSLQELFCSKIADNEKKKYPCGDDSMSYCFVCSVCNQVFDNISGYVAHSLNHFNSNQIDPSEISESKPYECEICMKKFSHHQKVQAHFLWHLKMIKSPFSESVNNSSNIISSLYNSKDSAHAKARFQIAKKSIFSKMAFDNTLTENRFHGYDIYTETPCNKCSCINCHCQVDCSPHHICFCLQNYHTDSNKLNDQKLGMLDCNKRTSKKCVQYRENSHIELHNYCQVHSNEQKVQLTIYNEAIETKKENDTSEEPNKDLIMPNAKNICHNINKHLTNDHAADHLNNDTNECKSREKNDIPNEENSHCEEYLQTLLGSTEKNQFFCMHSNRGNHEKGSLHCTEDELETLNKEQDKKNYSKTNRLNGRSVCYSYNTLAEIAKLSHSSENTCLLSKERNSITLSTNTDSPKNPCVLRSNFSELLYLLIGDPELMQHLGWGEKEIDVILEDVLSLLGQTPIQAKVKLEKFRLNISLLLKICIKDSVVDELKSDNSSIDDVVFNILQLCKSGLDSWSELSLFDN